MRWVFVILTVVFILVVIDMYMPVKPDCFMRNVFTSLYIMLPLDETEYQMKIIKCVENDQLFNVLHWCYHQWSILKLVFENIWNQPVCTSSPISNSDMVTVFPFLSWTSAMDGKHGPPPLEGGGEGGGFALQLGVSWFQSPDAWQVRESWPERECPEEHPKVALVPSMYFPSTGWVLYCITPFGKLLKVPQEAATKCNFGQSLL